MPANVSVTGDDALTLDMVGQYSFCPRRFHLMYVEGRWADNQYTVEGRHVHRRVDRVDQARLRSGVNLVVAVRRPSVGRSARSVKIVRAGVGRRLRLEPA